MLVEFTQLLIYGLVLGGIIALGAIGVSLTFGVLRFANFAHGDYMTWSAYLLLTLYTVLQLPLIVALALALAASAATAVLIDHVLFRRFRSSGPLILLISSFGVGLMLRALVQLLWGPEVQVYAPGIQLPYKFAGLRIKPDHFIILGGAPLLMVGLHLLLTRTLIGKAMRAVADNPELARVSGIDVDLVIRVTWIVGAGLAAIAGFFLGLDTRLLPGMGWHFLLPIFAAAILGGIGSPYGAIAGGFIIGIAQEFSTVLLSPAYKPAVAFALMVVILIVRPTGLFRGRS